MARLLLQRDGPALEAALSSALNEAIRCCVTDASEVPEPDAVLRALGELLVARHIPPVVDDGRCGRQLGVRVGWLVALLTQLPRAGMTTAEVCEELVKPATRRHSCRYADLASVRAAGHAQCTLVGTRT